ADLRGEMLVQPGQVPVDLDGSFGGPFAVPPAGEAAWAASAGVQWKLEPRDVVHAWIAIAEGALLALLPVHGLHVAAARIRLEARVVGRHQGVALPGGSAYLHVP